MTLQLPNYMTINKYNYLTTAEIKNYQSMDTELLKKELTKLKNTHLKMRLPFKDIEENRPFNAKYILGMLIKRGNRLFTLDYDTQVEIARNSISEYYTITYPDVQMKLLEIETLLSFKEQLIQGGSPLCKHNMQGVDPICVHCGAVNWG